MRGKTVGVSGGERAENASSRCNYEGYAFAELGLYRMCAMSAALVLPRLWATSTGIAAVPERRFGPISVGCGRPGRPGGVGGRLHLVSAQAEPAADLVPELAFYRKYTEALLRRYMRLSFEVGRPPSLLGRELFRGNVSHCKVRGFDDVVIFVHDVEKCLAKLGMGRRELVDRIALQGYSLDESAEMLRMTRRTVSRRYLEALDLLTALFMERKMLEEMSEGLAAQV